ncbi:MAG: cation:proton antiporter [Alicyclobacillaceae bacterium]|nr:cation:proton antiporter [Alicyclobacillaceae bacterium]
MNSTTASFLLILATGYAFSLLTSRIPVLRIPTTVSYLLFGILLQTGWIPLSDALRDWINHLAEFGLLFLMYVSGLEIDLTTMLFQRKEQVPPKNASESQRSPIWVGSLLFFSTFLISFLLSNTFVTLFAHSANPYYLCLLFTTTSLGVVLPVLEEMNLVHGSYGQAILTTALLSDFLTMVLLSVFVGHVSGDGPGMTLRTLAILPFTAILYLVLRAIQRFPKVRAWAGDAKARLRAILAILGTTCLLADATGAEPILGSFLIGMLVAALPSREKSRIREYSHGLGYGFLIPLFFLSVGMDFDLRTFQSRDALLWLPLLLVIAVLSKIIPALMLAKKHGQRASLAAGCLLSARLSLIAAAAQLGVSIHLLPEELADGILLVAAITALIAPVAFVTVLKKPTTNMS